MLKRICFAFVCTALVSGCASLQLNFNALDLASTVDSLLLKQVLLNLSRTIDNDAALPTQVSIAAGTVSTTNTLAPAVSSIPLATSSTTTNTIATAAATTITNANAVSRAAAALAGTATNNATQTWTIDPATDAYDLSRMRALYQYVICRNFSDDCDYILYDNYPVQTTSDNNKNVVRDVSFLVLPRCVICLREKDYSTTPNLPILDISKLPTANDSRINPKLHKFHIGWLGYSGYAAITKLMSPRTEQMFELGHFGNHDLFIGEMDLPLLSELSLFIDGATSAGSASAAAGGGAKVQKTFNIITR